MRSQLNCYYWIAFIICIVSALVMAYIETKIYRPTYWFSFFIVVIVFFGINIISTDNIFDADGNQYNFIDWEDGAYKNAIYYTKDGEAFYIQDDKVISKKDSKHTFDIDKTYLDSSGNLIFDKENKFHKTWRIGIFSSTKQEHVYEMSQCGWDVFGNFKIPEARGFRFAGYYFSPCSSEMIDNPNIIEEDGEYEYEDALEIVTVILILIFAELPLVLQFISMLILIFSIIKAIIKKTKVTDNFQYKFLMKYFFAVVTLLLQTIMLSSTNSFIDLILRWISYMILLYIAVPYLQGGLQISYIYDKEDEYPNGILLKDMFQMADGKETYKLRVRLMVASSISMVYWIITSIIYSVTTKIT